MQNRRNVSPDVTTCGSSRKDGSPSKINKIDNTTLVAEHYNTLEVKNISQRNQSRIVYMRNFNNWIKSMLIGKYTL